MSELLEPLLTWLAAHEGPWAYLVLAIAAMLEYVVPPIPGDAIALFGIFLGTSAGWSTLGVYVALNAGSLVGGMLAYGAGRALRERRPAFLRGPRAAAALAELEAKYASYGAAYLAVNRFLPALRAFFFVAAGISGLPPLRVAAWGLVSALAWNALLIAIGLVVGASYAELASGVGVYALVVLAAVVVAAGVWFVRRHAQKRKRPEPEPQASSRAESPHLERRTDQQ